MSLRLVNPVELGAPQGFTHGIVAPAGARLLFVAGQTATASEDDPPPAGFADQFDAALARTVAVVRAAGGDPADIGRMVIYVTDVDAYRDSREQLAAIWRARMGTHYPTIVLIEVTALVDPACRVEIEATAALPPAPAGA